MKIPSGMFSNMKDSMSGISDRFKGMHTTISSMKIPKIADIGLPEQTVQLKDVDVSTTDTHFYDENGTENKQAFTIKTVITPVHDGSVQITAYKILDDNQVVRIDLNEENLLNNAEKMKNEFGMNDEKLNEYLDNLEGQLNEIKGIIDKK
jgi:hypothetical protein